MSPSYRLHLADAPASVLELLVNECADSGASLRAIIDTLAPRWDTGRDITGPVNSAVRLLNDLGMVEARDWPGGTPATWHATQTGIDAIRAAEAASSEE